jgi:hypothetical protein
LPALLLRSIDSRASGVNAEIDAPRLDQGHPLP